MWTVYVRVERYLHDWIPRHPLQSDFRCHTSVRTALPTIPPWIASPCSRNGFESNSDSSIYCAIFVQKPNLVKRVAYSYYDLKILIWQRSATLVLDLDLPAQYRPCSRRHRAKFHENQRCTFWHIRSHFEWIWLNFRFDLEVWPLSPKNDHLLLLWFCTSVSYFMNTGVVLLVKHGHRQMNQQTRENRPSNNSAGTTI